MIETPTEKAGYELGNPAVKVVEHQCQELTESAEKLKDSSSRIEDQADRTILAAERTYAAWVRTLVWLSFAIAMSIASPRLQQATTRDPNVSASQSSAMAPTKSGGADTTSASTVGQPSQTKQEDSIVIVRKAIGGK